MKTLSVDLRQRILNSYDEGLGNRQEIADRYRVSLGMVKKFLVQRKQNRRHRPAPSLCWSQTAFYPGPSPPT